jgi:hypothetical protein
VWTFDLIGVTILAGNAHEADYIFLTKVLGENTKTKVSMHEAKARQSEHRYYYSVIAELIHSLFRVSSCESVTL